jgi:hypothetical protein
VSGDNASCQPETLPPDTFRTSKHPRKPTISPPQKTSPNTQKTRRISKMNTMESGQSYAQTDAIDRLTKVMSIIEYISYHTKDNGLSSILDHCHYDIHKALEILEWTNVLEKQESID